MSEKKLRTAVLGLGEDSGPLLRAAEESSYFEIAAVADRDSNLAERKAREYSCQAYDDYRQLVIQNEFDCLFVTAGLHGCLQYVKEGINKGFHILKLPPPGRDFEEAAELVLLADEKKVKFGVADTGRFSESCSLLGAFLSRCEGIYLLKGICSPVGQSTSNPWRSDPRLSGGGVLLYEAYSLIDVIMSNFPIPEQVYCVTSNIAPDKRQRQYLPEDTVIVTMKFSDNMIGNILVTPEDASRQKSNSSTGHLGPDKGPRDTLKIYGKDGSFRISRSETRTVGIQTDSSGEVEKRFSSSQQSVFRGSVPTNRVISADKALRAVPYEIELTKKVVDGFGLSILVPEEHKFAGAGFEHLKTMGVIESAYLSSRTGMPEEPQRILQMKRGGRASGGSGPPGL